MLIDVCVNLANRQFRRDREAVIERATAHGVDRFVICATDLAATRAALAWCEQGRRHTTAGVHPHDAASVPPGWLDELRHLAQLPEVCAIGETGLDFFRDFSPRDAQLAAFDAQLALACDLGKPLFVHDRQASEEVLQRLLAYPDLPPVLVHCFTGSRAALRAYLDAGCYIGITGWIADAARGATLRDIVAEIPLHRLMLETDAPFLRPHNAPRQAPEGIASRFRGRNEPALLPYVLDAVAACRPEPRDEIAAAATANATQCFGLSGAIPATAVTGGPATD